MFTRGSEFARKRPWSPSPFSVAVSGEREGRWGLVGFFLSRVSLEERGDDLSTRHRNTRLRAPVARYAEPATDPAYATP